MRSLEVRRLQTKIENSIRIKDVSSFYLSRESYDVTQRDEHVAALLRRRAPVVPERGQSGPRARKRPRPPAARRDATSMQSVGREPNRSISDAYDNRARFIACNNCHSLFSRHELLHFLFPRRIMRRDQPHVVDAHQIPRFTDLPTISTRDTTYNDSRSDLSTRLATIPRTFPRNAQTLARFFRSHGKHTVLPYQRTISNLFSNSDKSSNKHCTFLLFTFNYFFH